MNAPAPGLKSARFRREREGDWLKLEKLLRRLENEPVARLSDDELLALPVLYRSALSSLSVARETSLDQGLLDYLESLCTRAYFVVYGARPSVRERVLRFFRTDWPEAARALWKETTLAGALFVLGVVVAYLLYRSDPDWFYAFIPKEMAGGRGPASSAAMLKGILYDGGGDKRDALAIFATFLFTHNAGVALFAFALGFAFGAPTGYLMVVNGCTLGALFGLYAQHHLGFELVGWLMIHGVTEIFATWLAAAGGFKIGWTLAFPGARSRVEALGAAGRQAATLMAGVVVMLLVAGLLEGVGRQVITNDFARYGIAAFSAILWGAYLYIPRKAAP